MGRTQVIFNEVELLGDDTRLPRSVFDAESTNVLKASSPKKVHYAAAHTPAEPCKGKLELSL